MRKLFLLGCLGLMATLTACNTVAGVGQDLSESSYWVKRQL